MTIDVEARLISPGDPRYEAARRVHNAAIDRRPAAILECRTEDDVAAGLRWAARHQMALAIRGGGHSVAGFGTRDGALVLDLGPLCAVSLDTDRRIATCGGGTLWRDFDEHLEGSGLATPGGVVSSTGVGGLTLGGGVGWLSRQLGMTCDNLVGARVVTADGTCLEVSEKSNPELLWGLRGGGGNFGVVTEFQFQVFPVPLVSSSILTFALDDVEPVLLAIGEWGLMLPDNFSMIAQLGIAPKAIAVSRRAWGQPALMLMTCDTEGTESTRAVLRPLISEVPPLSAVVRELSYGTLQRMLDSTAPRGHRHYWKSGFLDQLDEPTCRAVATAVEDMPTKISQVHLIRAGGEVAHGAAASAVSNRDATWLVHIMASWEQASDEQRCRGWARRLHEMLAGEMRRTTYQNFAGSDDLVLEAGSDDTRRLQELKTLLDPHNVFDFNHNIRPDATTS